ncbi:eco57I restriction-modification methylase family protein [Bacillus licheniformis]|uniref:Eco57I restriction-modification methylase domain-containing protein n=1 Tax=Bacillus licheniformis TaxID=1402 RepID=UPI0005CE8058|nr:class I SAM-dependent methyltransferase [Bacillus licheniformis]KJE31204.1 eco57I restriction-modification methylase family protein [Bacillus licheniformis]OAZ60205.1 Site-specific DNA-methyltransferase (adenine-specific) [Bacillus licheniformis]TWM95664.1 Modification methylase Eco57IB [Bacillus licheniformis]
MSQLVENINPQKLRGGYYTPKDIADFLCKWSIQEDTKSVLEPSCGDGNFIESAILRFKELNIDDEKLNGRITGIELIEEEALKAQNRANKLGVEKNSILNSDFFKYAKENKHKKYDVIIGNPPFIRYQNFPEEHRNIAMEMMKELGLKPNKLTNIWVPFLVVSAALLNDHGKMAMIIPAELFQVKYAAETRVFLSKFFNRITIITFEKLVFENIQQEVVILLCEKKVDKGKGIRVIECENLDGLNSIDFAAINGSNVKPIEHSTEKWTKYFLEEDEILLLQRLKKDPRIKNCNDYFKTEVGLVTGRNEFFMMKENQVKEWNLEDYTIPVAGRSNQLKGITFTENDFRENSKEQKAIHLFLPPDEDFEDLPFECQNYIKYGEEKGFHQGYKTRIRKRWYITPSRWVPDAFALRQVDGYPKLILNETGASSTDTIHRVRFKENVNKRLAVISFLNSLTFASSEVTGRSYGGGVMTFEPSEIGEILIPSFEKLSIDFDEIDTLIRKKEIEKVLDIVDEALLIKYHGFSQKEVNQLRGIWKKLSQRRINRTKK